MIIRRTNHDIGSYKFQSTLFLCRLLPVILLTVELLYWKGNFGGDYFLDKFSLNCRWLLRYSRGGEGWSFLHICSWLTLVRWDVINPLTVVRLITFSFIHLCEVKTLRVSNIIIKRATDWMKYVLQTGLNA